MACCLAGPSHYLNHCWQIISAWGLVAFICGQFYRAYHRIWYSKFEHPSTDWWSSRNWNCWIANAVLSILFPFFVRDFRQVHRVCQVVLNDGHTTMSRAGAVQSDLFIHNLSCTCIMHQIKLRAFFMAAFDNSKGMSESTTFAWILTLTLWPASVAGISYCPSEIRRVSTTPKFENPGIIRPCNLPINLITLSIPLSALSSSTFNWLKTMSLILEECSSGSDRATASPCFPFSKEHNFSQQNN